MNNLIFITNKKIFKSILGKTYDLKFKQIIKKIS